MFGDTGLQPVSPAWWQVCWSPNVAAAPISGCVAFGKRHPCLLTGRGLRACGTETDARVWG